mmetsp:Transcript_18527/g.53181  ORF Transcript_18527/g.53181 Transcript_18527/m.53181 type:complete len:707 (+) Transcript_18527:112-2232(+)
MSTTFGGGPAPFSFHCIICFEAFNLEDRPPVILPCGHTYVCAPCSKRLDKCMECRTSLFIKPDDARRNSAGHGAAPAPVAADPPAVTESMPSWYRPLPGRAHSRDATYQLQTTSPHGQAQRKRAHPAKAAERIPLPMPKNLVMMSLMEAAEEKKRLEKISHRATAAAAAAARNEKRPTSSTNGDRPPETVSITSTAAGVESIEKTDESFRKDMEDGGGDTLENDYYFDDGEYDDDDDESSKAYESGDDDSAVKLGIRSLLGTCGTYVVKDEAGLEVLPRHPSRASAAASAGPPSPPILTSSSSPSSRSSRKSDVRFEEAEPIRIFRGQTVQVSYIDETGVAVLARGSGFILADEEQMVKVGAPRDRACQIEGTLRSIETKKQWYSRRLAELPLLEQKYAMDLDAVVRDGSYGQYPVIGPPPEAVTYAGTDNDDAIVHATTAEVDECGNVETSPEPTQMPLPSHADQPSHISPGRQAAETTPKTPNPSSVSPGMFADCSPYTIDNSEIGPFVLSDDSDDRRQLQYQPPTLMPQPLQRQDSNNIVSNLSLGCGFLAGNSYLDNQEEDSLVGLSFDSAIDLDRSAHSSAHQNSLSPDRNRPPEYPRTPDRSYAGLGGRGTGSFDTMETTSSRVDFRSGYSGHRGVMGAKSHADRMREKARRDFRSMGEHRGIATVSSRLSASSGSQQGGGHSATSRSDRQQVSRISDAR